MTRLTLAAQSLAGGILMLSWVIVPALVLWSVE
jgi:hypothetical protein